MQLKTSFLTKEQPATLLKMNSAWGTIYVYSPYFKKIFGISEYTIYGYLLVSSQLWMAAFELILFTTMSYFYSPENAYTTFGFLMFSGSIEIGHWRETD